MAPSFQHIELAGVGHLKKHQQPPGGKSQLDLLWTKPDETPALKPKKNACHRRTDIFGVTDEAGAEHQKAPPSTPPEKNTSLRLFGPPDVVGRNREKPWLSSSVFAPDPPLRPVCNREVRDPITGKLGKNEIKQSCMRKTPDFLNPIIGGGMKTDGRRFSTLPTSGKPLFGKWQY